NVMIRPDADAAEEARKHQLASRDVARARSHQIVADHANVRAEVKDVPAVLAEDAKGSGGIEQWVTFAGDGFDQRGFAATVRAEDSDVLAGFDREAEAVQGQPLAALYRDVGEFQQWWLREHK